MQTLTPVPLYPVGTLSAASSGLKRLGALSTRLSDELKALPVPHKALLAAAGAANSIRLHLETSNLLERITAFWDAPSAPGETRYEAFLAGMKQALRDEISVKLHERDLEADYVACLPASTGRSGNTKAATTSAYSLHIQLRQDERVQVAGALALSHEHGRTLLVLPGIGAKGFVSHTEMFAALAGWLNDPQMKSAVLNNIEQRYQDQLVQVGTDADLYLEPFTAADLQWQPIERDPFAHALDSLLNKQRGDVRYACAKDQANEALIQAAIDMRGLFGPAAMLELRELAYKESQYRTKLPDWIKFASQDDLRTHAERLQQYDQAGAAVSSVLGAAASPQAFAEAQLRTCLANDLGYALDPAAVTISTRRALSLTGETYTLGRSLVELALYGLHPGDRKEGSEFLKHTTISLAGAPLEATYAALTPAYIARVVEELDLRVAFGKFQQAAYRQEHNQRLMGFLTRKQIALLACAAKMQGHIRPDDFDIVEAIAHPGQAAPTTRLRVQQIKLDNRHVMGRLLVFRKDTEAGQLDRLVMVATDKPQGQSFKAFDSETQLRSELIGWLTSDDLCTYLIDQVQVDARPQLTQLFTGLKKQPYPKADFLQLVDLPDFDAGLRVFTEEHARVAQSEQARHTPEWFQRASLAQRQELVALEDAALAVQKNYEAQPHTRMQPFKDYTHERATQQISKLLNVPVGSVNPDLITITTERENVTYTELLLNGYDDSIDFTRTSADTEAEFDGPKGVDLSALSPRKVAGSVRGKWLGDDYIALIRRTLLDTASEGYHYRRQANVLINQLQMKAAALRSLLKGQIQPHQYAWLKDSLDHVYLNDATTRAKYPLYPLQIHVDKPFIGTGLPGLDQLVIPSPHLTHIETVQGCLILLPTHIRLAALLYTPLAPDGIEFRLFADFEESLDHPGMIEYYTARCRIKAGQTLTPFLRDMQQGKADKPVFIPKEFIADFADTCFNRTIERKLRDVDETTTSRTEMLGKIIWTSVEIIATVLTLPFPPASFAVGALIALHDNVRAFKSLAEGDGDSAVAYALSALLNSLGAAGDLHSGIKGFGGLLHRLDQPPKADSVLRPLQRHPSLPRYEDLYPVKLRDEPFLVDKPNANGHAPVLRIDHTPAQNTLATGQFATREANGTWQPLGQALDGPSTASGARAGLEVKLSLHTVSPITEGHAKGVCIVNGKHYIELSGKTYQVHYDAHMKCWQIIDPENPFAFFGKQPVRLDEQGKWQLAGHLRLRGGGLDSPGTYRPLPGDDAAASAAATRLGEYELPQPLQPYLDIALGRNVADPSGMGLEDYFEAHFAELRQTFTTLREKLYRDAKAFFVAPPLPPKPSLPAITPQATIETLFESLFTHSNGLVLSEGPTSVASKRLLILNMPLLVKERVEVLYIEHLFTDKHLHKLARYRQLGKKTRSGSHEIKNHLDTLNDKALDNQTTEYDYYHLIKAAHRHGIEVRPFNSSISYPFVDHPVATAAGDAAASQKMSNFFGHKVIGGDTAADSSRRWIALLDEKLATTHDQLPGIAELQGVPSVHIQDVASGRATRIKTAAASPATTDPAARGDFTIEFANPLMIAPRLPQGTSMDIALFTDLGKKQGLDAEEIWVGDYGFRWDETAGWLHVEPEHWTPNSPPSAIQQSLVNTVYETPESGRSALHRLANFEQKGLDQEYLSLSAELNPVREAFFTQRRLLQVNARSILAIDLPARPTLPDIAPHTSLPDVLKTLYQHTDAVVIGESHFSIASKKLIIDNLPLLSRQNVKTLYMEHLLTDLHQADLDRFFETGQMSKTLLHDLKKLDRGHHTDPTGVYTFEQLVVKARQHGLEIRAVDCTASYHLKGIPGKAPTTRQQMMSYFASRIIERHQQVMGSHKWIALVGNSHSNTYQKIVPGLAELEGGIGLRVVDVLPGQSKGVFVDPGETLKVGLTSETVHIQGDYRVEIEIPRPASAVRPPFPLPVELRLSFPGMFLIEQGSDGLQTIVHRSRDTLIHRTPVLANAEGKIYLERPSWAGVHLTPYDNMDALVTALEELNLTRVA